MAHVLKIILDQFIDYYNGLSIRAAGSDGFSTKTKTKISCLTKFSISISAKSKRWKRRVLDCALE